MRLLPAALAISAAVHGALIVWVETHPIRPQAAKLVAPPIIEITEIVPKPASEPAPMTVALLDDHTTATTVVPRGQPAAGTRKGPRNTSVTTGVGAPAAVTSSGETAPGRSSLMTMRGPEITSGMSSGFTTSFLSNSRPLPPSDEQLAARRPDGTRELSPDGAGKKSEHQTFKVKVAADGTVDIHDKANWQQKSLFSAEFDATDAMMRRHGIDPYSSYKMKVLDETREERVAMGKQYRTQQLARSGELMRRNLDRLVASVADPATLKEDLFELWDDCAETGSDELVAGGKAARAQVIGFIRAKLPVGSANAFSVAELEKLNSHRRSRDQFDPYN